jgi:hypothetical protein
MEARHAMQKKDRNDFTGVINSAIFELAERTKLSSINIGLSGNDYRAFIP